MPRLCCELSQEEPAFLMVLEGAIFLEDCFEQEVKEVKLDTLFHFLLRLQMPLVGRERGLTSLICAPCHVQLPR